MKIRIAVTLAVLGYLYDGLLLVWLVIDSSVSVAVHSIHIFHSCFQVAVVSCLLGKRKVFLSPSQSLDHMMSKPGCP